MQQKCVKFKEYRKYTKDYDIDISEPVLVVRKFKDGVAGFDIEKHSNDTGSCVLSKKQVERLITLLK